MVAIGIDQKLSNIVLYENESLEKLSSYKKLLENVTINMSIHLFLKKLWYKLIRGSLATVKFCLALPKL